MILGPSRSPRPGSRRASTPAPARSPSSIRPGGRSPPRSAAAGARSPPPRCRARPPITCARSGSATADESLYGLGQHQQGLIDIKGYDLDLRQYNTEVFVPFLVSSRGYGILWDNTSFTRFGDLASAEPHRPACPYDAAGDVRRRRQRARRLDAATIRAPSTGDYLFRTYSSGDIKRSTSATGSSSITGGRAGCPTTDAGTRPARRRRSPCRMRLRWTADIGVKIAAARSGSRRRAAGPRPRRSGPRSATASTTTFVYGPELDAVVAGYRRVTGAGADDAALGVRPLAVPRALPHAQREPRRASTAIARAASRSTTSCRTGSTGSDDQWGSHEFDPDALSRSGRVDRRHPRDQHARLMISVWPKFYPGTANFEALDAAGLSLPANLDEEQRDFAAATPTPSTTPSIPTARAALLVADPAGAVRQGRRRLVARRHRAGGRRGAVPDAGRPGRGPARRTCTRPRSARGSRVLNAYSLVNSQAVYEGQRAAAPDQRVFILTRIGVRRAAALRRRPPGRATSRRPGRRCASRSPPGSASRCRGSRTGPWTSAASPSRRASPRRRRGSADARRVARAAHALVPVRRRSCRSCASTARRPTARCGSSAATTAPRTEAQLKFDRLRYRLLPYIYSLAGRRHARRRHDAAPAGDGLSRRRRRARTSATSTCSGRRCWSAR